MPRKMQPKPPKEHRPYDPSEDTGHVRAGLWRRWFRKMNSDSREA